MKATTGKDPGEIYAGLAEQLRPRRLPARSTSPPRRRRRTMLKKLSPEQVESAELAGEPILDKLTKAPGNGAPIGGLKVVAEHGWFAARPSGTEDVYKVYAESLDGEERLERILDEAQEIVDAGAEEDRPCRTSSGSCSPAARASGCAADARPREAGRAVRRQLPADRLRAVEPRQRRLPPDRRAHAVQEPLARPPHRARPGACRRCSATTSRRCRRRCGAGRTGSPARPTRSTRTSTCSTTSGRTTSPCSAPTTSTGWTRARWSTSTSRPARR